MENEIAAYLAERRQAAPITLELERLWLLRLALFCQRRELNWRNCKLVDLRSFREELLWTPYRGGRLYANNTLDIGMRTLRAFYRWAHRTQRLAADPTAGWVLQRPPQVQKNSLSRAQTLRILNLPDLSQPLGQRDQVFLELLYYQLLSLTQCLKLTIQDEDSLDEAIRPHLRLYLQQGRPSLAKDNIHAELLLSRYGHPLKDKVGLHGILRKYSSNEVQILTPRLFHQSHREHQQELTARRLPPPGKL